MQALAEMVDPAQWGLGPWDLAALVIFAACWLGYEPLIRRMAHRHGALNNDMELVRAAWMRAMVGREIRLLDAQLMGHAINSASFFASANLILIAAVGGVLFGGEATLRAVAVVGVEEAPLPALEAKFALITLCLARGLLDFIWSIRQLNYTVAMIGASPDEAKEPDRARAFAEAASAVLNPALNGFSRGVRAYYFALAAGAWLFGPLLLALGALGAFTLLAWRQGRSPAARGVREARRLLAEASENRQTE